MIPDHRELGQMQLAEEHGAGSIEALDHGGIRSGSPIAQELAGTGSRDAFCPAEILDGDGYTMQRPAPLTGGDFLVGSLGLVQCRIIQDGEVCAQRRVERMNPIEHSTRSRDRRNFAFA